MMEKIVDIDAIPTAHEEDLKYVKASTAPFCIEIVPVIQVSDPVVNGSHRLSPMNLRDHTGRLASFCFELLSGDSVLRRKLPNTREGALWLIATCKHGFGVMRNSNPREMVTMVRDAAIGNSYWPLAAREWLKYLADEGVWTWRP